MRAEPNEPLDRRARILEGARTAFLQFGFDRSSIADIAKGSGVSRTALYHYFPSKEEVLQALVEALHSRTHELALEALERSKNLEEALSGLIAAKFGRALALMNESPNGVELVDATHRLTGPATLAADQAFQDLLVKALEQYGRSAEASAVADTLFAAAKGLMRAGDLHATIAHFHDRSARLVSWVVK
jgi:AcrR family transcriptional regulator